MIADDSELYRAIMDECERIGLKCRCGHPPSRAVLPGVKTFVGRPPLLTCADCRDDP